MSKLKIKKPSTWYVGSLVQQNFGETYDKHGYAICDLTGDSVTKTFHDIQNEYGMYTLLVDKGVVPNNLPITSKTTVRIQTTNTDTVQLKKALATLKKLYKVKDVTIQNLDKNKNTSLNRLTQENISNYDVRDITQQNNLIKNFFDKDPIDPETLENVVKINTRLNNQLNQGEVVRNVIWKPKKFEFNNMFSYGEDNVINFDTLEGTCGLFAPNHSGKSAALDALCFCLFDQSFRASKAEQVLNRKKDGFWCRFNFDINGLDYFIEKTATRYVKGPLAGKLRVDINFWYITHEGETITLNGEQRRDTDKIIQSYIGNFDDFILTALSLQGNNSNFIDKTQGERKDLLSNFLDLKIFDTLYELANKENKAATIILEEYQKHDYEYLLMEAQSKVEINSKKYAETLSVVEEKEGELQELTDELISLNKDIKPCKAEGLSLENLQKEAISVNNRITQLTSQKQDLANRLTIAREAMQSKAQELRLAKESFNTTLLEEYKVKEVQKTNLDKKLDTFKINISNKLSKLDKLKHHEYDPNCKYCVSNVFVQDAIETKQQLEIDKDLAQDLLNELKVLSAYLTDNKYIQESATSIEKLNSEYKDTVNEYNNSQNRYEGQQKDIRLLQHKLDNITLDIQTYEDNINIIENNKITQSKLDTVQSQIKSKKITLTDINNTAKVYHSEIRVAEEVVRECSVKIQHIQDIVEKQIAYDYYCKAIGKEGIPYDLISRAVPYIQESVNEILSQVIDFTVELETDGKNINAFICYDSDKWPLELSSGMERFLASLAIRLSLIKITNLPKPNFIAIDEGLGVLDSSNLNSIYTLFNHMKGMFKFSLIISHIDVVRDMVDTIITIDKKNDMSYINH